LRLFQSKYFHFKCTVNTKSIGQISFLKTFLFLENKY